MTLNCARPEWGLTTGVPHKTSWAQETSVTPMKTTSTPSTVLP